MESYFFGDTKIVILNSIGKFLCLIDLLAYVCMHFE